MRLIALLSLLLISATALADDPQSLAQRGAQKLANGEWRAALGDFRAAAETAAEQSNEPLAAYHHNNTARLHLRLGEFDAAAAAIERGLQAAGDSAPLRAFSLLNRGDLLLKQRDYTAAITQLEAAEPLAKDQPALLAQVAAVRGAVLRQQGDFDGALHAYEQSKSRAERAKDAGLQALADRLAGEAWLHRIQGDADDNQRRAESLLQSALAAHRSAGDQLSVAMAESHLGELAWLRGDHDGAAKRYREAGAVFKQLGYRDGVGRMDLHLGFALSDGGEQLAAKASFESALAQYRELGDREWQRVALFGLGQAKERSGDAAGAERDYRTAIELFEGLRAGVAGGEPGQALFTLANRRLYERLITLLVARDAAEEALEFVERSRLEQLAEFLLSRPGRAETRDADADDEGTLEELRTLQRELAVLSSAARQQDDPQEQARLVEQLAATEREAARLIRELGIAHRGLAETLNLIPNTRGFRQQTDFPDELALLSYFVTEETLYAFLARKGQTVSAVSVAVTADELRDAVAQALVAVGTARDVTADPAPALARLHHWLIAPLRAQLGGVTSLAVLPHRWLNYLPFAALHGPLRNGDAGWLIEDFRLQQLSAQSYASQLSERSRTLAGLPTVLALGNPELGDPARALPFAAEEARHIGRLFPPPNNTVLIGAEASKVNLLQRWGQHRVVHIAAHAQLGEQQAEILLSPAGSGILGIDELFDLAPAGDGTALMVLSACQTAVDPGLNQLLWRGARGADLPAGPPIASAAHSLLLLGVPSVVASLWKVDDRATALLMRHYYTRLRGGDGYYASLRRAQLALAGRDDHLAQPYYWAAFQFFGLGS